MSGSAAPASQDMHTFFSKNKSTQRASKERVLLKEQIAKVKDTLKEHRSLQVKLEQDEVNLEHVYLDCHAEINLFFQTMFEEIERLKGKEVEKLTFKKKDILSKVQIHRQEVKEQINFLE